MLDINFHLIIAQVITFLVGLFLLWLVAYKPIMGVFRKRADKIKEDLDAAESARVKMEASKAQYDSELAVLTEKGRQIVQQAARDGQQAREAILQDARAQSQDILRQAEERITVEKEKAIKELRQEVITLSMQIAEKVIQEAMNPDLNRRLANQTLDQLERKA
ncbi:MAG: F0F1 ATP synthase subunit B [Verrucomicrobia bacterium]|nr:F0F1 ATP synthase subunit B [Verrucomicrobiota bacterium]MCG2680968.1 F0F1 ATP synthase subunit B [Kiritimatiellia bacterium]MBU4248139.1 F0F1 ATP synthase subunit B [Verrucomicrobiota bacterium]MBU4290276.1 F0F1 ATP synthase subunit B [Verrucomicrobiota bacterium]MBU4428711.1 F0F1 ATP synthase subunit B [Verrucomicrobiota bacterium]